ncbi:protein SAR DEFICIENT 1-like isoform X2 [Vigna umbellata]|uniref:protein SAR DEFICIENT 1-like isoform X1 n=1 Tax=Vigna umbellata TaxID=87088 RepID=UPI001F5EF438|nr:protein SAR DEFICIENT 1-like isoform X1 [Vigna umbellata]XP_047177228.1 protein SAR DEFICIENT 1-like isoform X2 [Vigna umbellata]
MAAKRLFNDSERDPDEPDDKRIRNNATTPSFASVIGEVVMIKNFENLFTAMEPVLKRVVGEEVERVMRQWSRSFTRSPSLRLQAMEQLSSLQLCFSRKLFLPIFTGSRILDVDENPINIVLMDRSNNNEMVPTSLPHAIKLEILVIDGDFSPSENEDWTSDEFNRHIVKERHGKRPLLAGELNLIMRDGIAPAGDMEFTDNSSWIRCRKFRVAVRVAPGSNQGVRIREGMTEAFMVKDHRGELYKKHYPPMLDDEVWRLEKIGKDGAFNKKLSSQGLKTVQEFLKLAVVDTLKLRNILGVGMSDKMWEVTIKHAMTCDIGSKLYIYRGPQFIIFLDPICRLIRADISGQTFSNRDQITNLNKTYVDKLVRDAYARWPSLEVIDAVLNDNIAVLTQGDQTSVSVATYDQNQYYSGQSASYVANNNTQMGSSEWSLYQAYSTLPFANGFPSNFSATQTDGDMTASGSSSGC